MAEPGRRVEHVRRREVTLIYIDESHFHQDPDHGSTRDPEGRRSWWVSTTPGPSERLN